MFIASCPECGDSLTFPSGVALSSRCRCPLCTETFTLEECLSELPPMAELLDGEPSGGGFSPGFAGGGTALATAPRTATASSPRVGAATAGTRTGAGRAPAKKAKGGNPIVQMAQIVIGGAVGVGLAVLIIWWGLGKDPFSLAPTVAEYAPFLVPAQFRPETVPVSSAGPPTQTAAEGADPVEPLPRDASGGVRLDSGRFGLDEERPQPNAGRGTRSSLDPDAGELAEEPVVDALMPELDAGDAFALEDPSLDSFAIPGADFAPATIPSEETPDEFSADPTIEEPMADAAAGGEFNLEPFAPEPPMSDAEAADRLRSELDPAPLNIAAIDPFEIVFPTATEDLPDLEAAEAESWNDYQASTASNSEKRPLAEKHYAQLAQLAETLTGLPPAPRSNAAAAELNAKLADRFDEPSEQQVANYLARLRLTDQDFDMAGVVVVGRVVEVQPEGQTAVVTLSLESLRDEAARRLVAVARESQGIPEQGSVVVAMGVKLPANSETLPASLAEEQAPIILAGAFAPIGGEEAAEAPAVEEASAPEPSPSEPAPTEPKPEEGAPAEPAGDEPMPAEPMPSEPEAGDAPEAEPAPVEPAGDPAPEEPAAEEPAPSDEAPDDEPPPNPGS